MDVPAALTALSSLGLEPTSKVCSVRRMLDQLPEEYRDQMAAAVLVPGKSLVGIRAVLLDLGFDIATTTISRHRSGVCKCPKH